MFRPIRLYRDWAYQRELFGRPDSSYLLPFSRLWDQRFGRLGRYIWFSRRIQGWTRGREAIRLAQLAFLLPADAVLVEIGSFLGCSTVLLAGARKVRGDGIVHCIDPFDASGDAFSVPVYDRIRAGGETSLLDRFHNNLERAGVRDWVQVHHARAEQVVSTWSTPIDLLFLDGNQAYEAVQSTYDAWVPFLRVCGILAIHNSCEGYRQASHDGSSRLVEERIKFPAYQAVERANSITFAWKCPDGRR